MMEPDAGAATLPGALPLRSEAQASGDQLADLYDRHAGALYRYARALTGSAEDAEDAVQEVFCRAARHPARLERVRDARAYLLTAVRNAARSTLRGRRRRSDLETALPEDLAVAAAPDPGIGVVDALALREAFAALPVEQREVLALKVFEGMTFREIAATTRASQNTVASRYRYAIEKLRRALEEPENG
ncbi:MAG: sigma-70 family RNA polymerase sigma factor [Armatimonadetes bacterium]|nr:sigma-70 family RNA polymerase sigma factor [Armatimonadota bacterium]